MFNRSDSTTVSNAISGTGSVTLSAGSVTLSGNNSYGATTVNAGQLTVGNTLTNSGALSVVGGTISQSGYAVSAAMRSSATLAMAITSKAAEQTL